MAQDPYRLDTSEELRISTEPPAVSGGDYDGLVNQPPSGSFGGLLSSRRNIMMAVGLLAVVGCGTGYLIYSTLFAEPEFTPPPAMMGKGMVAGTPGAGIAPPADPLAVPAPPVEMPAAADVAPAEVVEPETKEAPVKAGPEVIAEAIEPLPQMPAATEEATEPKQEEIIKALQPIDPQAVTAKAGNEKAPSDIESKTAKTIAAVNEILGRETTPSPAAVAPPPVEVISRAKQVINVQKSYSAQSPQAVIAAGDRVLQAQQYEAAVNLYNQQLSSNPSDLMALSGKALALQKAGQIKGAMDTYQRLLDLNPQNVDALTNYLGLLQQQNPDEAMGRLSVLEERHPDNASVVGQIASVYAAQMDAPNALRYFMKAHALDDTNPVYPMNIAILYDRLGTSEKARDFYKKTLKLSRDYPERAHGLPLEKIRDRLRGMSE